MTTETYRFNLGDFECISISDGSMNYPLENFFANVPRDQVEALLRQRNLTTEHITTPYTCLFVNTGQHKVMVDTGSGHNLGPSAGKLLDNMKGAGLEPADIDTVIITHAHPDHIGGNLDEEGRLNFANAQYFIWKHEWNFWMSETAVEKAPEFHVKVARKNLEPIQQRLSFVDQETEIVPGLRALAAPGHTPGHMALSIFSGDDQLLHISDTVLYPVHLEHPDWLPVFDILPQEAATSKRRIFDRAATEKVLVFAHHFPPFPNLGHVASKGNAWQWQPLEIS